LPARSPSAATTSALRDTEVLFHVAGYVASSPIEHVWQLNARGPDIAVQAAAAAGVRRVVVTSTISAIGTADGNGPADEDTRYPDDWLGLLYPDSKHAGETAALEAAERHDVEVVVVNPAYVLGVPVNRAQPGETSTRTIGNCLRGRLPGVIDAPMNFVDVQDVARGHLLAGDRGCPGQRYILGGENLPWPRLIDSGRGAVRGRPPISAEAFALMGQDWRFTAQKAREELGFQSRPLGDTLEDTIDWYLELIGAGAFDGARGSGLSRIADSIRIASRLGLLTPIRMGQRVIGRRIVAGG
jgi:dihydroflavonol-4-reductase